MKAKNVLLTVFLILSVIGCRESLINQPDAPLNSGVTKSPEGSNISTGVNPMLKGEIPICCASLDPLTGDCTIEGKVMYIHEILNYSAGSVKIELNLEMDAEMCSKLIHPLKYGIQGYHTDIFYIAENGKLLLDKTYNVSHRPDLRLCVQYMITTEKVAIMEMNLLEVVEQTRLK